MRFARFNLLIACLLSGIALVQSVNAIGIGELDGRSSPASEDNWEIFAIDEGGFDSGEHSCEGASHEHIHYNSSTNTPTEEYWGVVHAFAIVFEDDFMESVDTETNFLCSDGSNTYRECGFNKETDLGETVYSVSGGSRNGVTVTYQTLDWIEGNPKGLLWKYGTDHPDSILYKPWLESGEQKTEGISFQLIDYDTDQTATTTSWTKTEFYYIDPDATADERSSLENYTHIYTEQAEPYADEIDPDGDYIYWYGLNGTTESTFPACPPTEEVTCDSLSISPTTAALTMSDVFSDVEFEVTATGSDDSDITNESEFTYSINKYGSANTAADADGYLRYGRGNILFSKNPTTTDSTVRFDDTEPGDTLYVYVSDFDGSAYPGCNDEIQLPYCTALDITEPTGRGGSPYLGLISEDVYSTNIDIETDTSSGESWPFNVTYGSTDPGATFDGNSTPYTTTDNSIGYYVSTESATVGVGLDDQNEDGESDDVAGVCNDEFYYTILPTPDALECESLEMTTETITAEAMEAGNVEISWESYLSDGSVNPSSYYCESSNPDGVFVDEDGNTGTGTITTDNTTVYYTGEPGDIVGCRSQGPYISPRCVDSIESETGETPEGPVCTDLSLLKPYIYDDSDKVYYIDLSDVDELELLYAEEVVCFDFTVNVEAGFTGQLQATGYTDETRTAFGGLLELQVDGVLTTDIDNPAVVALTSPALGNTSFSGTVCWENFDENYVLDLAVVGSESVCYDTITLPELKDEDTPNGGGGGGGGGGGSGSDRDEECDVDDDDGDCTDGYQLEVCVGDEDVTIESDGNEICYDEDGDGEMESDECEDDELVLEDHNECYDVTIGDETNMCNDEVSITEDNGNVCWEVEPELDVGNLNKYIYTFNFIDEKVYNSDEEVFFTHDEDRVFYTLEYSPVGTENVLVFTDEMWDDDGIEGVLGDGDGEDSNGKVWLADTLNYLTNYNYYDYSTIQAFGFGDKSDSGGTTYEEGSEDLANYVQGFTSDDYETFVAYLKYEDSSDPDSSKRIEECTGGTETEDGEFIYADENLCYDPVYQPQDNGKVVILNADQIPEDATLRIRYVGVVESGITEECDDSESTDSCLTEVFENTAQVYADPADIDDPDEDDAYDEDSSLLVVLCAYLMTENAGDIYLEGDLDSGADISCAYIDDEQNYSSYSNTDGLVILDNDSDGITEVTADGETVTYTDSETSSVSFCDSSTTVDNLIGNISSYVCEIVSAVSDLWKSESVESTTDSNVSQAVRNAETAQAYETESYISWNALTTALTNTNNPDSGILYFEGSGEGSSITLSGEIEVDCGAWTLIVEDADLIINSNIKYKSSGTCSVNELPSIAFIVEGGDIQIWDGASSLVGVYYTNQDFTGNPSDADGRSAVDGDLTISGSLYGNINPLLDAANYVGSPSLDGGGLVVSYDSRILLNTPPALSEYVDVNTEKAVN